MTDVEKGRAGSTLDEFLAEEGVLEEATGQAVKEVLAWQIEQEMKARRLKGGDGRAHGDEPRAARPAARSEEHLRDAADVAEGGVSRG